MSWKFNSSHINSLTVSNLRTDVTSDEFFQKTFYGLFTADNFAVNGQIQ